MNRLHETIICSLASLGIALLAISLVLVPTNPAWADPPGGGVGLPGDGCDPIGCDDDCYLYSPPDCPNTQGPCNKADNCDDCICKSKMGFINCRCGINA